MPHHKSIADLQRDADHAMYHAKKMGRNRICLLDEPCYIGKALAEQEKSTGDG
jgi:predicted signal transduction protein with EAL and GGDEF domain